MIEVKVVSDWIPCSVKAGPDDPDELCIVCVSGRDGNITYDHAVVADEFTTYEDNRWHVKGYYNDKLVVHAWMPLPEPYEGE